MLAEDKKPDETPKVFVAQPLTVARGSTGKLKLRGLKLAEASEVRIEGAAGSVKLLGKDKAALPNGAEAAKWGDTQVEIELVAPDAESVSLIVKTPGGETKPYTLPLAAADSLVVDKEPNDGFAQAQPIELGKIVVGAIDPPQNVDVYLYDCAAAERIVVTVEAAKYGSLLDAALKIYDAQGAELAGGDDQKDLLDPKVELALPSAGKYWIVVFDSQDQGSPAHGYRLSVRRSQ